MTPTTLLPFSLERMYRAVEKVRERVRNAAALLERAGIPYAVCGDNAVEAWVSRIDEAAVRSSKDVEILLRRDDLPAAIAAFEVAGLVHQQSDGRDLFLESPEAKIRDAVHVLFSGERVRASDLVPAPDVSECDATGDFRVLALLSLVRMKLNSYRRKDQVHLLDMLNVGLIDASWISKVPPKLAARLKTLVDDPDG